jgi:hypothetical protein
VKGKKGKYQFDGAEMLLKDPRISEVAIEPIINQSVGGTPGRIGWEGAMSVVRHTVGQLTVFICEGLSILNI